MADLFHRLFAAIGLLGFLVGAAAPSPAVPTTTQSGIAPAYPIAFSLAYNDRILGTPTLYLKEGNSAVITVPRQGGYALRATLGRQPINNRIMAKVQLEVYREAGGKWLPVSSPTLIIPFGGSSSFALDRPGGGQPIFRLEMKMGQAVAAVGGKNACTGSKLANWNRSMALPVSFITKTTSPSQLTPDVRGGCCEGGCYRCCGDSACCADPRNCSGEWCTN